MSYNLTDIGLSLSIVKLDSTGFKSSLTQARFDVITFKRYKSSSEIVICTCYNVTETLIKTGFVINCPLHNFRSL